MVWRMNPYFLLFLAVMFYPYVMQVAVAFLANSSSSNLIGSPAAGHLALLYLPLLLLTTGAIIHAITPRHVRPPWPSGPDQPSVLSC